jgi:ABC-type nickel/cobalt efflux system permease component RcnA
LTAENIFFLCQHGGNWQRFKRTLSNMQSPLKGNIMKKVAIAVITSAAALWAVAQPQTQAAPAAPAAPAVAAQPATPATPAAAAEKKHGKKEHEKKHAKKEHATTGAADVAK